MSTIVLESYANIYALVPLLASRPVFVCIRGHAIEDGKARRSVNVNNCGRKSLFFMSRAWKPLRPAFDTKQLVHVVVELIN